MQVTLVANPSITVNPGKGRPWKKMEVLYRNTDGKVMTKVLVSFKNPTVFKTFSEAKQGDVFEVESVQSEEADAEGRKYWEWKSAHSVGSETQGAPAVDTAGTPAKPVTKMVVTEADRNRFIVRQSSLERAIETLSSATTGFGFKEVTLLASQYEGWVFRPVGSGVIPASVTEQTQVAEALTAKPRGRPRKLVDAPEGFPAVQGRLVAAPAGTENLDVEVE